MRPLVLGIALLLHAVAQASAGTWASGGASPWLVTPLWFVAMLGYLIAALGVLGVERLQCPAASAAAVAAPASLLLYWIAGVTGVTVMGMIGSVALSLLTRWWARCCHPEIHTPTIHTTATQGPEDDRPSFLGRVGVVCAYALLGYTALLVLARPWHLAWGATAEERDAPVRGTSGDGEYRYRIDHGVTVRAPPSEVWPWIAQLGQDRAGFYSYDWLERAFGDDIRNVDSLVPAWQERTVGDLVRATQPDYLGGRFGRDLGWRITLWEPPRVMVLQNWGTFSVRPIDDVTSRLLVQTRGEGRPSFASLPLIPLGFYLLEPAHFIMERGMLLGIKARAERHAVRTRH